MDPTEPTLAAMSAAAEQARAANHHAYDAPGDPPALYARTGALYDLLAKTEQLARFLSEAAAKVSANPPEGLYSDDGSDHPRQRAATAAAHLAAAAETIRRANVAVNEAWSELAHLGVKT